MLRAVALALVFAASPAIAEDCYFSTGDENLYFASPMTVAVSFRDGHLPYACSTYSAGTGVPDRMIACSDGYEGRLVWKDDTHIVFRDKTWEETCIDG